MSKDIKIAALLSMPRVGWTDAWASMEISLQTFGIPVWRVYGAWWHHGIDKLFARAIELDLEWVLTLDYDSVFTAAHLGQLFNLMRTRPDIDALCPMQANLKGHVMVGIEGKETGQIPMDGPPMQVDMGHFGCTVIRVHAIRETPRPWFREEPDSDGGFDGKDRIDADAAFWKAFRDSGHRCYVAPGVQIGHLTVMVRSILPDGRYDLAPVNHWLARQLEETTNAGQGH